MKKKRTKQRLYFSRMYYLNLAVFCIIICIFAGIASYFSYKFEMNRILQANGQVLEKVSDHYEAKQKNFWSNYIPVLANAEYTKYFEEFYSSRNNKENALADPTLRKNLSSALNTIVKEDGDIAYILLRRKEDRDVGYLYIPADQNFQRVGSEFPYMSQLQSEEAVRRIFPAAFIEINRSSTRVYAIAGGVPIYYENQSAGDMLICYSSDTLDVIYQDSTSGMKSPPEICIATTAGDIIYDSSNRLSYQSNLNIPKHAAGGIVTLNGERYYTQSIVSAERGYSVTYLTPWAGIFRAAHQNTPVIMGIAIAVTLMLALSYKIANNSILKRVKLIRSGLEVIGQNNLNYQIPMEDSSDEFGAITRSINSISRQLAETVDKLYIYQLKQKTAELGELQAKFNPHFLYNTLDVICAHAYENDDQDVAEMLVLLSRIFRSFINNKSFITIQEEITFCNMYLELFRMRYKENMNIEFNVKKDVMAYGIIRNLLQPLIENYFVHGFKPQEEDNWILISATLQGPEHIVLSVSDNGFGMSPDRMQSLQEMIEDAEGETTESYGLRNLHDRVRIFYGPGCGFRIEGNEQGGVTASITIRRMTCQEHEDNIS